MQSTFKNRIVLPKGAFHNFPELVFYSMSTVHTLSILDKGSLSVQISDVLNCHHLLGYVVVQFIREATFRRIISHPSSGLKISHAVARLIFYPEDGGDTFLRNNVHIRIRRCHFPEDGDIHSYPGRNSNST
jgi:hypothetical protein